MQRKAIWGWSVAVVVGLLAIGACNDDTPVGPNGKAAPTTPSLLFANGDNFNGTGACLAHDAAYAGFTSGVNGDTTVLASSHCTAKDIKVAHADLISYSTDGTNFTDYSGQSVACNEGDTLWVHLHTDIHQTDNSQRTDIGMWVAVDGGNARTGTCNHYNLIPPSFSNIDSLGVWNIDGDHCGDMNAADSTSVDMGTIKVLCETATDTSTLLHVGSCLGWTQPGANQQCPQNGTEDAIHFRYGTVPGTTSKCNCEGFNIGITVNRSAWLEVKKVCDPTTDTGTFDLLIDGSNQFADNASCGGTTSKQKLSAGTNASPGAAHNFGEGDFTTANYTSSYSCVNRSSSGPQHVFGANGDAGATGTSLGPNQITLQPNEDVVCTYTNVRKPQLKLVKSLDPTTDAGKFDFAIGATTYNNSGAGYGDTGNTGFQNVTIGTVAISESAHSGTTLSNYTSTLACKDAANADVTVSSNAGASGSISVAAGDQITCTFTNTRKPEVKLVKVLDPTNDPGKFDLILAGTTYDNSGSGYGNNGTTDFQFVSIGAVSISEAAHTGTTLSNYTSSLACKNAANADVTVSPNTGIAGSITVAAGDQITCTFTNARGPEVKLVKVLDPTTDPGKVDLTIGAQTYDNGTAGYGNNENTGFKLVPAGSVSISESGHTGTTLSNYSSTLACKNAANADVTVSSNTGTGGSITVASGDQITCTFTNVRKPEVKLVKAFDPTTDPGKVEFSLAGTSYTNGSNGYGNGGNTGFQFVPIGPVSISETAHTGTDLTNYTSSLACKNASNGDVTVGSNTGIAGSITVAAGDQITCTFTNVRKPEVKVVKALDPTTDPGTFDLSIGATKYDNAGNGYGNGGNTGFQFVAIGSVTVSESGHTGTTLSNYSSTLSCKTAANATVAVTPNSENTSGTFTVAAGDQITCTFTNSRGPEVKLVKAFDPTTDPGKVEFTLAGTNYTNGGSGYGNGGNTGFQLVSAGTVSFSETAHTGTDLGNYSSSLSCKNAANGDVTVSPNNNTSGSITVAAGDQITCTFTNTRKPQVKLVKSLSPTTDPGTFDLTIGLTTYNNSGAGYGNGGNTGFQFVSIGNVSISEAAHSGTTLSNYSSTLVCKDASNATVTVGSNTGTSGSITVAAGDQITCTFTNTRIGRGAIAPTQTTCQDFASSSFTPLDAIFAGLRGSTINSVSPGVFFYYAEVVTSGGSVGFTQTVLAGSVTLPKYQVQQGQAFLYNTSCAKVGTLTLDANGGGTISGVSAGSYYLGVKFSTDAIKGFSPVPSTPLLMSRHQFSLTGGGSQASVQDLVKSK